MVKCSECGFLSVRNINTSCFDEAGSDFREKGIVALGREYGRNPYNLHEQRPVCFIQCHDLRVEIKSEFESGKDEKGCVLSVINKERRMRQIRKMATRVYTKGT